MNVQRLDNKRTARTAEGVEAPVVSVTKSYAKLSPAAVTLLGLTPGESHLGFGFDSDSNQYMIWKAADSKSGKKLSKDATIVSESIYGHLKAGAHYVVGVAAPSNGTSYFPLQEGVVAIAPLDTTPEPQEATAEPVAPENW